MSRRKFLILTLAAVMLAIAGGTIAAQWANSTRQQRPEATWEPLVVDPDTLDLGKMWAADRVPWVLRVTNRTADEVVLETLKGDCSCISVGQLPVRFGPGETREVRLVLDLNRSEAPTSGTEARYHAVLTGSVTDGNRLCEVRWELSGRTEKPLRVDPTKIRLGVQSVKQSEIVRTVTVDAAEGVAGVECEESAWWRTEVRVKPGGLGRFEITIRSRGPLSPREVADVIVLHPASVDGRPLPAERIEVVGEVARDVVAMPRVVHLGRQTCGTVREECVRLESLTGQQFRVKEVQCPKPEIRAGIEPGQGSGHLCRLSVQPSRAGEERVSVGLVIEEAAGDVYTLEVPVSYIALAGPAP